MTIINIGGGGFIITGERDIKRARILALKQGLKLELMGLHKRGASCFTIIKRELGFKGNKQNVFNQLCKLLDGAA